MTELEKNVLEQMKRGDEKAFEYIFKTYYSRLYHYACEILKNHSLAEEITEDTFVKLWESRERLSIGNSLSAYLFRSIFNQCLNFFKHQDAVNKYQLYFRHHILSSDLSPGIDADFPLSRLIEKELGESIEEAIGNLPGQCREIFMMSRYEHLKNEEIAEKLGVSVNTVRTQISRALAKLRNELKEFMIVILWIFIYYLGR